MLTVYALIDPRSGPQPAAAVRYVGITGDPVSRLANHISSSRAPGGPPVRTWIRELHALRLRPLISALEHTVDSGAEGTWIRYLRESGCPLLNIIDPPEARRWRFDRSELSQDRNVGPRIAGARERARRSIEDLADVIGLPVATLIEWEAGRVVPQLDHFRMMAILLGVPAGWLAFGG